MVARLDREKWFRCAKCGHKLGRACGSWDNKQAMTAIEIKCHSCGTLNYIMIGRQGEKSKP